MKLEKKTIIWTAVSVVIFIVIGIILWSIFKTEEPKLSKETQQLKGFTASILERVGKYNPTEYSSDTMKKELIETVTLAQVNYKSDSVGISTLNIMDEINGLTGTSEEILNEIKTYIENYDIEGFVNKIESSSKPTNVLTLRSNTVCDTESIDDKYCLDGNNSKLSANVYVHDEESTKWVVLLHPFMTNGSVMYGVLGETYKELGYNVLAPDLRGFGNSSGKVAMGYLESLDTYDWLLDLHYNYEKRYGVKNQPDTIIIHGISLGAATTLQLATNPDIAALEDNLTKLGVKAFYDDGGYTSMGGLIEDILVNQDMGSLAVILSSLGVDFEDFMKNLQNTLTSLGITGLEDFNIDNIADMEEFFNEVTDFVNYIKTADIKGVSDIPADIKEKLKKYLPEDIYNNIFNSNLVVEGNKAITNTYGAFNFGSFLNNSVGTTVTNTVGTGLNSMNYSKYSNSFSSERTFPEDSKVVVVKNENDTTIPPSNAETTVNNAGNNLYYEHETLNTSSSGVTLNNSGKTKKETEAIVGGLDTCVTQNKCETTSLEETIASANSTKGCNVTYETAQKMIQEAMRAYYNRGPYLQYNTAKFAGIINGKVSPEEATSQDNRYLVCSGFVNSAMRTAFGIHTQNTFKDNGSDKKIFEGTHTLLKYASKNTNNKNLVLFYGEKNNNPVFLGNKESSASGIQFAKFVAKIQPGDIFVYTGHTMVAYKTLDKNNNGDPDDVLLLHSWQAPYIKSRLPGTYRLSYNNFPPTAQTDSHSPTKNYLTELASTNEGTIKQALLSNFDSFVFKDDTDGKKYIRCSEEQCAVIRPFYKATNDKAEFNFTTDDTICEKAILRTEYPNIKIEKTSSIGDKNIVSPEEKITYTIKLTNNNASNIQYKDFYIEETLDNNVDLVSNSITGDGEYDKNTRTIKWHVGTLSATKTVTYEYQVAVKNNIGKTIKSTGKFYKKTETFIETGIIENKIVKKPSDTKNKYETCYNKHKDKKGLALIEATYNCATDTTDYNFSEFDFEKLISKKDTEEKNQYIVTLNSESPYSKMVLNNYWNGLVKETNSKDDTMNKYFLPRWTACTYKDKNACIYHQSSRAKTINPNDFKDGDILIYYISRNDDTFEIGTYAYIYINGKFIGVNKSGLNARNEFYQTYYARENWPSKKKGEYLTIENLYTGLWKGNNTTSFEKKFINYQTLFGKDYYVILRPSLLSSDDLANLTK